MKILRIVETIARVEVDDSHNQVAVEDVDQSTGGCDCDCPNCDEHGDGHYNHCGRNYIGCRMPKGSPNPF